MTIESIGTSGVLNQNATGTSASVNPTKEIEKVQNDGKVTADQTQDPRTMNEQDLKKVKDAVGEINSKLKNTQTRCEYEVNERINRVSIKIMDKNTDEVIREVPPEKTLEMIEKAWEIAGLIVDEKR
ncbi:MAG: flagellar protein FlaG [Lachnospiraceae bacterium]|nr:flagellar protein FlaG [Lachnospiraceae bacterium]